MSRAIRDEDGMRVRMREEFLQFLDYSSAKNDSLQGRLDELKSEEVRLYKKCYDKIKGRIVNFYNSSNPSDAPIFQENLSLFAFRKLHRLIKGKKDNIIIKVFLDLAAEGVQSVNPLDRDKKTPFFYVVRDLEASLRNVDRDAFRKNLELMQIFISYDVFFHKENHFPKDDYKIKEVIESITKLGYVRNIKGAKGEILKFLSDMEERSQETIFGRARAKTPTNDISVIAESAADYEQIDQEPCGNKDSFEEIFEESESLEAFPADENFVGGGVPRDSGNVMDGEGYETLAMVRSRMVAAQLGKLYEVLPAAANVQEVEELSVVQGGDAVTLPTSRKLARDQENIVDV